MCCDLGRVLDHWLQRVLAKSVELRVEVGTKSIAVMESPSHPHGSHTHTQTHTIQHLHTTFHL